MQLKTIFNRVTNYKPFVVESAELVSARNWNAALFVAILHEKTP